MAFSSIRADRRSLPQFPQHPPHPILDGALKIFGHEFLHRSYLLPLSDTDGHRMLAYRTPARCFSISPDFSSKNTHIPVVILFRPETVYI